MLRYRQLTLPPLGRKTPIPLPCQSRLERVGSGNRTRRAGGFHPIVIRQLHVAAGGMERHDWKGEENKQTQAFHGRDYTSSQESEVRSQELGARSRFPPR
jgi:hypothetical protein